VPASRDWPSAALRSRCLGTSLVASPGDADSCGSPGLGDPSFGCSHSPIWLNTSIPLNPFLPVYEESNGEISRVRLCLEIFYARIILALPSLAGLALPCRPAALWSGSRANSLGLSRYSRRLTNSGRPSLAGGRRRAPRFTGFWGAPWVASVGLCWAVAWAG